MPSLLKRRRHADVRQHDVGRIGLDRLEQRRKVGVRADDLDIRLAGKHLLESLPDEKAVVCDDDAQGHLSTIPAPVCGPASWVHPRADTCGHIE